MQDLKFFKGSKLIRLILIAALLVVLLFVAVFAADYTVTTSPIPGNIGVGDNVELSVSFTNNTNKTVNGMLMRATLPKSFLTLVNNSVRVRVNNGQWNQATSETAATVRTSLDYRYNYASSSGALLVSLGNIAPGETVTIALTVNITSMDSNSFLYNFYKDHDTSRVLCSSTSVSIFIYMDETKPVVEKTSRNITSSGAKANVGDVIEYTIKATNDTPRILSLWTDVTVTDKLPDGVSFIDGSVTIDGVNAGASQYSYNASTKTLTVYLRDLGPNASSTVTFHAEIDEGTYGKTISNSAIVSGKDKEDNNQPKTDEDNDGDGQTVNSLYTITFYKNANDAQGTMNPQNVVENNLTQLNSCEFTRTGYIFLGWSENSQATTATWGDRAIITPTKNMTLYAVWTTDACTITFYKNAVDATGTMDPQKVSRNVPVTLKANEFVRTGHEFLGWSEDSQATTATWGDKAIITPTRDMDLYAVWKNVTYTITYDRNASDATGTMTPQIVEANVPITLKPIGFTRPGYVFVGWSTVPSATESIYSDRAVITPTGDMVLYAVWKNATYTITFDKNATDATGTMSPQSVEANVSNTLKANEFVRTGHEFLGWSEDSKATVETWRDGASITPTRNMELYAVWKNATYTITFDKNATDATGTMTPQSVEANVSNTLKANEFSRPDYYFRGWSTSPDGEIAYSDRGSIIPTDNITLFAVWGANPCTITFHKNSDYAMGTMSPQIAPPNVPVALNPRQFERSRYSFEGWSTNPNAVVEEYKDMEVIIPVDNMDLYAVWREIVLTDDHIAYINGYPGGGVRADSNITRAEAVTVFFRLLVDERKDDPVDSKFSDVESGKWYVQIVNYMAKLGIINGYPDGSFRPNEPIKRAEFAKIASRFDNLGYPQGDSFSDVKNNHWAYLYVNSAYEKGWINGYEDGTFKPERNISRAEVVSIVNRMLERKIDNATLAQIANPYTDIFVGHWAYKDVIEASISHEYKRDNNRTESWVLW